VAGLYLHLPFCRSKCHYCDFYSRPLPAPQALQRYVTALCRDLQTASLPPSLTALPLTSLFFGGGTPSLLTLAQLEQLLTASRARLGWADDIEISLEVNPATVDDAWLRGARRLGLNRLSVGVQCFDDTVLQRLGRCHDGAAAVALVQAARQAGFDNIGLDLMFAVPGLPPHGQLEWVKRLAPEHLSLYGLTIEPGTPLAREAAAGRFTAVAEEDYCAQYLFWHEQLSALGYDHYEIANYARPGHVCRHNLAYWQRRPYLGLGAGAHSFFAEDQGQRWAADDDWHGYCRAIETGIAPRHLIETFSADQARSEWVYLRLRTAAGVDEVEFRQLFGADFASCFAAAVQFCGSRLQRQQGVWRMAAPDWLLFDHLISPFLS